MTAPSRRVRPDGLGRPSRRGSSSSQLSGRSFRLLPRRYGAREATGAASTLEAGRSVGNVKVVALNGCGRVCTRRKRAGSSLAVVAAIVGLLGVSWPMPARASTPGRLVLAGDKAPGARRQRWASVRPRAVGGISHVRLSPQSYALTHFRHPVGRRMVSGGHLDATLSSNWSGLVTTGSNIQGAEGAWTVPAVTGASGTDSASWVGVDGVTSSDLIQTGTAQTPGLGYSAWWEILPAPSVTIVTLTGAAAPVAPGDSMLASVEEVQPGTWTIYIADQTQNWYFQNNFSYSGPGSSAEWIEEAPTDNGQQTLPADFGTVQFSETGVYGNFGSGAGWYTTDMTAGNEVDMVNSSGTLILAAPGAPTPPANGGQSFSDTYILPPDPPSGLAATTNGTNVTLTWQAPAFSGGLPTNTYIVGQQQPDGSYSPIGTVSSTSATLSNATAGATYTYAVAAQNTGGWVSNYSLPTTVTAPVAPPAGSSPPTTAPPAPPAHSCVTISGATHIYGVHGIAWVNHVKGDYGPWNVAIAARVGAHDSVVIATSEWGHYPPGHGLYVSAASPIPMPAGGSGTAKVYAGVHGAAPFTATPAVDITWSGC